MQFSIHPSICGLRSHTHINTFISSLPAYLPIDHSTFDCEMQVSIFGILPSDFVFYNSCKVFWKIWFVIPKTWLQEGKIVEEMHYSCCTEGNLWDVGSTCSWAWSLYISVLVFLWICVFVYLCILVFVYLCNLASAQRQSLRSGFLLFLRLADRAGLSFWVIGVTPGPADSSNIPSMGSCQTIWCQTIWSQTILC